MFPRIIEGSPSTGRHSIFRTVSGFTTSPQMIAKLRRVFQDRLSLDSPGRVIQFRTHGIFKGRRIHDA
jgi:hypothetical protein